jgi:hypothetical protein
MNEYRCTRPDCYRGNCPGAGDPLARQGYYIDAKDENEAHNEMREKFPKDSHFEVRLWKSPAPGYAA